jgi:hypothetical protein
MNMADLIISEKRRDSGTTVTATSEATFGFTAFEFGRRPGAFILGLCVGDREARADCQCGELIDRIAASLPVRKLLFVEALGHVFGLWHDRGRSCRSTRPERHAKTR